MQETLRRQLEGNLIAGTELRIAGQPFPIRDHSAPAGNFAIPLHSISGGHSVEVILENTSSQSVPLLFRAWLICLAE